jgi:DNA-binding transcriptional ArsR family regulator
MLKVRSTEIPSRFGKFSVIKIGQAFLIGQCDTRMKILEALARTAMTGEELTRETGLTYSAVMDHMDLFERLGLVSVSLKRGDGPRKRRIFRFHLNEDPLEGIEELFSTTKTGQVREEVVTV